MKKRLALVIVKIVGAVLVLGYAIFCVRPLIQSFNLWVKDGRNIYFAFTPPTMVVLILGAILCSVILSVIAIKSLFYSKSCDVAKVYIESLRFEMRKNKEIKKQKRIQNFKKNLINTRRANSSPFSYNLISDRFVRSFLLEKI